MLKNFKKEIEQTEKIAKEKIKEIWNLLMPTLKLTQDQKVISKKIGAIQNFKNVKTTIKFPNLFL